MLRCSIAFLIGLIVNSSVATGDSLDPRGEFHIPIGIANCRDSLKTFAEPEGNFSPGFASYGIYFWLYDHAAGRLFSPTQDGMEIDYGLHDSGYLIPWSQWKTPRITVRTELCQVEHASPGGSIQVVGCRVRLSHDGALAGADPARVSLYVALRPLGPAGGAVKRLTVSESGDALLVDDHPAAVALRMPAAVGVLADDQIGRVLSEGEMPNSQSVGSSTGDCSGALRFDLEPAKGATEAFTFVFPVLAGRRAMAHDWDGASKWAQFDLAKPNGPEGELQPNPGLSFYRELSVDRLFEHAEQYWQGLVGKVELQLPDDRWRACFRTVVGHAAMAMNDGTPDVAVINYNVFNRDGVYVANILQKSGNFALAAAAIDYFREHPFNGRTQVEADNPGQILWAMGEHWLITSDRQWLDRVRPDALKLAEMIRYYRTTPEPHYVKATSLEFGDALPSDDPGARPAHGRQVLKPGSCDGHHPEYTEAFDIAGLRAAAMLANAPSRPVDEGLWNELADQLMESYDDRFGARLADKYGSYCVLWPCRLYEPDRGKAYEQFKGHGPEGPGGWRYFALAKAHQGLLTGCRESGYETLQRHFSHPQMRDWYAFDEGGRSGSGGWKFARTTWNSDVAMPHGWAIAEVWLLLRDCLAYEYENRLHLFGGVPPEWFLAEEGMTIKGLPTHFGPISLVYHPFEGGAQLQLKVPGPFCEDIVLELPASLDATIFADNTERPRRIDGSCVIPGSTKNVVLHWNTR